jgi:hypothetical protein
LTKRHKFKNPKGDPTSVSLNKIEKPLINGQDPNKPFLPPKPLTKEQRLVNNVKRTMPIVPVIEEVERHREESCVSVAGIQFLAPNPNGPNPTPLKLTAAFTALSP